MIKYLVLWIRVKHLNSISKAETVRRKFILDIRSRDVHSEFITNQPKLLQIGLMEMHGTIDLSFSESDIIAEIGHFQNLFGIAINKYENQCSPLGSGQEGSRQSLRDSFFVVFTSFRLFVVKQNQIRVFCMIPLISLIITLISPNFLSPTHSGTFLNLHRR